jgi:hypothetical protein
MLTNQKVAFAKKSAVTFITMQTAADEDDPMAFWGERVVPQSSEDSYEISYAKCIVCASREHVFNNGIDIEWKTFYSGAT